MTETTRVQLEYESGKVVYSVTGRANFKNALHACAPFLLVSITLLIISISSSIFSRHVGDLTPYVWSKNAAEIILRNIANLSLVLILGSVVVILPLRLINRFSPRTFWAQNGKLFFTIKLLRRFKQTIKIPFDRISEVRITQIGPKNGATYSISAICQRNLPGFRGKTLRLYDVTLATGIPDFSEAEQIQSKLLSEITEGSSL